MLFRSPVTVGEELVDGQVLDVAGGLRVVHTPGHSPGHVSYLHEPSGVLVTGDAIFNVLGSLGVVLGSLGLAVVLARNLRERRGEFATLGAVGIPTEVLARMVGAEYGALVLISGNLPRKTEVVSVRLFSFLEGGSTESAAAVATVMLAVALLAIVSLDILRFGRAHV